MNLAGEFHKGREGLGGAAEPVQRKVDDCLGRSQAADFPGFFKFLGIDFDIRPLPHTHYSIFLCKSVKSGIVPKVAPTSLCHPLIQ